MGQVRIPTKEIMYSDLMPIKIGASEAEQSHVDGLIGIRQGTALNSIISSLSRAGHEMDAGRAHLPFSSPGLRARFLRIDSPLSSMR